MTLLADQAAQAYAVAYFGLIFVLASLEWASPRRRAGETLRTRWFGNIGIYILNSVLLRLLFPMVGVTWAIFVQERGWGLMSAMAPPAWLAYAVTVLALDLTSFGHHYLSHRFMLFWRLHRTHHTDLEFDMTTGLRFHPLEAILTTAMSLAVIGLIGAPPAAVLVHQFLFVTIAFFEHANLRLPRLLDRGLRLVVVTPDLHRVHHSRNSRESRANLGTIFPWWDRLFGTYIEEPAAGHDEMVFGTNGFLDRKHLTLQWMLATPFLPQRRSRELIERPAPSPSEGFSRP
jgi:sterol desaturase/sphingolipid hydroxylase (fatty acid hydroxylase superfamily)